MFLAGQYSGATRRYKAQDKHRLVRYYHSLRYSQRLIARLVGYHQSTVSRILRGIIRTCLNRAETLAGINAYPLEKRVMREPSYHRVHLVVPAVRKVVLGLGGLVKRKKRWSFCKLNCEKGHIHRYAPTITHPKAAPMDGTCGHRLIPFNASVLCVWCGYIPFTL